MANEHVLIVEDEADIAEMIAYNLGREGYRTTETRDGEDAVSRAKAELPDLIVLDLMLPGMDGLEVCRTLRLDEATRLIPIIMLTAKSLEADKVAGLELGADDYMTKPFSPRELVARIKAVLRRSTGGPMPGGALRAGEITLDSLKHRVSVSGDRISLTATEFRLLEYLLRRQGQVLGRQKILDDVFGYGSEVYDRTVDTHIKALRKKLGRARDHIETIRGVGYRFRES